VNKKLQLNAGTGMAGGAIMGALIALLVSTMTGDNAVWSWAIPVGVACGLAVGQGAQSRKE
jgi:hypothetical protein